MKNVFEELDKAMSQSATAETNATAYIAVEQSDNRIAYGYAVYIGDKCLSTGAKLLPSVTDMAWRVTRRCGRSGGH